MNRKMQPTIMMYFSYWFKAESLSLKIAINYAALDPTYMYKHAGIIKPLFPIMKLFKLTIIIF